MLASFGTSNDSEQPIPSVHTVWYSVLASGDIRASTSFLVGHQTATFFFLVPFQKRSGLNQCQVPPWPVIPYVNALSPQYRGNHVEARALLYVFLLRVTVRINYIRKANLSLLFYYPLEPRLVSLDPASPLKIPTGTFFFPARARM